MTANEDFLAAFRRKAGISDEEAELLNTAMDHDYHCRCNKCRQWWRACGRDPDYDDYGPFTVEEIEG